MHARLRPKGHRIFQATITQGCPGPSSPDRAADPSAIITKRMCTTAHSTQHTI